MSHIGESIDLFTSEQLDNLTSDLKEPMCWSIKQLVQAIQTQQIPQVEYPKITRDLQFLWDLSDCHQISCQSVLLQTNGQICCSKRTTRQLMMALNSAHVMDNGIMRYCAKQLKLDYHRTPLVHGLIQFMPLGGTNKGNTSWIGIHHLINYQLNSDTLTLTFADNQQCVIQHQEAGFNRRMHHVCSLAKLICRTIQLMATSFGFSCQPLTGLERNFQQLGSNCDCTTCQNCPETLTDVLKLLDGWEHDKCLIALQALRQHDQEIYQLLDDDQKNYLQNQIAMFKKNRSF